MVAWRNSGPQQCFNPPNNTAGYADALVKYNLKKGAYDSNENAKAAVVASLNLTITDAYKRVTPGGGVDTRIYQTTDDPRGIIQESR